jgi:hypothetical protein
MAVAKVPTIRSRLIGFAIFPTRRAASSRARARASALARAFPQTSNAKNSMPPCARSTASRSSAAPPPATRLSGSMPSDSIPAPPDRAWPGRDATSTSASASTHSWSACIVAL